MPPTIKHLDPDDEIYVAWITPEETCNARKFTVTSATTSLGWFIVDIHNDDHDLRLAQIPGEYCLVCDPAADPADDDDGLTALPVLAIALNAGQLIWQTQRSMLEMGYEPADAMDLIALDLGLHAADNYSHLRETPEQELRERVDEILAEVVAAGRGRGP